jgi:adenosylcobinamide-phosphate synthase
MAVQRALESEDVEKARKAVSNIVGRDTDVLDADGICRAAVETVAENTSDGVIAPLFWMILLGAPGGFFYKAVNTMDSMLGYKNDKYLYFGRAAARTDDVVNWLPARISAVLMIIACPLCSLDGKNAKRIFLRDRYKHDSPNSAQTESVCAGALGIRLAGDAVYGGVVHKKEFIGDPIREIRPGDIKRACNLMYVSSFFMLLIGVIIRMGVFLLIC